MGGVSFTHFASLVANAGIPGANVKIGRSYIVILYVVMFIFQ